MRVVHQLISYFRARGALSDQQLEQLRQSGFVTEDAQAAESHESSHAKKSRRAPGSVRWQDEDSLSAWPTARTAKPLGAKSLCHDLNVLSAGWPGRLDAMFAIAGELENAPGMRRSLLVVRQADQQVLKSVLAELLVRREVSLRSLTVALDIQDYRSVLPPGRQPTRALSAYRALMRTYGYTPLGKYAWILRYEPVNDVFNLILAKRAILRALRQLYGEDPSTLTQAFRGSGATNLFWAFVILRSALAEDPFAESRHRASSQLTYLDTRWPPDDMLERAALYALFMAPSEVLGFLTRDFDVPCDARGNPPWRIPGNWTSDSEKHYINFRRRNFRF